MVLSSICTWTQTHKPGARLQYCTRVRWHSVVFVHELAHKPGARLQYCTRVRWHSVVFVHELRHTNQVLDCSTAQGSDHLTLVQYCSLAPGVCLSSCTNTTECHLTPVQYCSLAPGLCVWVHVQILLSAIWPLHSVVFVHELAHKPGARLQYCTRVRWHSVVFVHELRHTNQELDCSTVQGSDGTTECHLTLVQYCSLAPALCVSSCTNTTESHLTLVQYCSLAPGLCVWVETQ
jgi:hypothetical protein